MKRTPEWYEQHLRKLELQKVKAIGSTSGGVDATRGDPDRPLNLGGNVGSVERRTKSRLGVGITTQGSRVRIGQAGIEPGPLSNIEFIAGPSASPRRLADAEVKPAPIYALVGLCRAAGLPEPIPEYVFHPKRKWRADYCWPAPHKLILEVDGGIWSGGRHVTGAGRLGDMEKQSEAAILGYRILYVTPEQVRDGVALDYIQRALRPLEFVA